MIEALEDWLSKPEQQEIIARHSLDIENVLKSKPDSESKG
jgi:hypothetical protein